MEGKLYKLHNDDVWRLKEAEEILRKHNEDDLANDISLLKGRIEYLLQFQK